MTELYTPRPFQVADLEELSDHKYTAHLAMEPGAGKTPLALFAARDSGASQTLGIVPKNTILSAWAKTSTKVLGIEARLIGNGRKAERVAYEDFRRGHPGFYVVTPGTFVRADLEDWRPDMLIVDEVHQLNKPGGKTQRQLSGFGAKDKPLSKQVGASLSLSGTPVRSDFTRAWSICRLHWPDLNYKGQVAHDNHYGWLNDRMTKETLYLGYDHNGARKTATKWLAEKEPGLLFSQMPLVLQHFRRRMCCWFHPNGFLEQEEPNVMERHVELLPAQKRIIRELEDQSLAWIDGNPFQVDLPMHAKMRIRQVVLGVPTVVETGELTEEGFPKTRFEFPEGTPSPVADEVLHILEQLGEEPVVIFTTSQRYARYLTNRITAAGISVFEYSGQTTETRDADLQKFGHSIRVLVGVLSAVGTGTDGLQEVCNNEIWVDTPVDDVDAQQGEGRLDRLGATKQVQRFVIRDDIGYAEGLFSEKMMKRLEIAKSTTRRV